VAPCSIVASYESTCLVCDGQQTAQASNCVTMLRPVGVSR
jgi:hypothetical protein